jgi:hypothetical protein
MAFSETVGGERYNLQNGPVKPKKASAAYLASATPPAKFHLVKLSTTANDTVDQCASTDVPDGYVFSVTGGVGTISVLQFLKGQQILFEYDPDTAPALGDHVVADGTPGTILIGGFLRDRVIKDVAVPPTGPGVVVQKDVYATNTVLVEMT